jgi:hypothetical protein
MITLWEDAYGNYKRYNPETGEFTIYSNYKKGPVQFENKIEKGLKDQDAVSAIEAWVQEVLKGQAKKEEITN